MSNFDWTGLTLDKQARQVIEKKRVEIHEFIRHRFDIGFDKDFEVKVTPINESPAYGQNLPTPINLKDIITVQLATVIEIQHFYHLTIQQVRESYFRSKTTERWTTSSCRVTKNHQPDTRRLYKQHSIKNPFLS